MWVWLLPFVAPFGMDDAFAGSARAELQRLDEEVRTLVEKNAWGGVERTYLQMAALESSGVKLTWEQHKWGALAAQARGDVFATWQRLRAAEAVEAHEETLTWLATVEATHGRAVIELSPLVFGEVAVESLDPVADPAAQRTIALASKILTETRTFDGLLPLGRYRIGSVAFAIDGGPLVRVRVEPGQAHAKVVSTPGTLRFVAGAIPEKATELTTELESARELAAGTPGVATVAVVPLPERRLYADFAPGSLDSLGLSPTEVAGQIRAALGVRATEVVVTAEAVAVPAAIGVDRLKGVKLAFDGGTVTVGGVCKLREAPDRTAPPPGLLLVLTPSADGEVVRKAILQRLEANRLGLQSAD